MFTSVDVLTISGLYTRDKNMKDSENEVSDPDTASSEFPIINDTPDNIIDITIATACLNKTG